MTISEFEWGIFEELSEISKFENPVEITTIFFLGREWSFWLCIQRRRRWQHHFREWCFPSAKTRPDTRLRNHNVVHISRECHGMQSTPRPWKPPQNVVLFCLGRLWSSNCPLGHRTSHRASGGPTRRTPKMGQRLQISCHNHGKNRIGMFCPENTL